MANDPIHSDTNDQIPDPVAVYERQGEAGLRDRLDGLDRDALERVVRAHPPTTPCRPRCKRSPTTS